MAKKKEGQTIDSSETVEDTNSEEEIVPEQEPKEPSPPKPEVPKEFAGKTPEDLIKMATDAQKELGQRAKEIGDLRNNLAYSEQLRELAMQRFKEVGAQTAERKQEPEIDWDFEKPIKSVEQIVERKIAEREKGRQHYDLQRTKAEAQSNYAEGRRTAMKNSPALFEGIEREAEDLVYNSYMNGIISSHDLRNPEAWSMAAKLLHLRDGKIDRLSSSISPVETISGELPTPARPGTTEKPFTGLDYNDEETRKMVKQYGLTKEEAEEIVKEEQEALERGVRK